MICPNCGKEIDDNSKKCEHCGAPVKKSKQKKPLFKRVWFWVIIVILAFGALGSMGSDDSGSETPPDSAQQTTAAAITEPSTPETVAPETTVPETTVPETTAAPTEPPVQTYKSGMYKVGSDIEAGEYFIVSDKFSTYYQVASDSSGTLDSILTNDNITTFAFITVKDGQYLTVEGGHFVKAEDALVPGPDEDGVYGDGMYRVGIDIPAGEYKVETTVTMAYIEVSSDSTGSLYSIVSNDNIQESSYITVSDGQYLTVMRGRFFPA